jgi:hypothetical protein
MFSIDINSVILVKDVPGYDLIDIDVIEDQLGM